MALAKVTEIKHPKLILADSGKNKGVRVSVAQNVNTPDVGAEIEISDVKESRRPVPKGDAKVILDANMISLVKAAAPAKTEKPENLEKK